MGGPGVSQIIFLRSLGGPIRTSFRKGLKFNKWAWVKFANIVSIDWPYGTGYSNLQKHIDYKNKNQWLYKESERYNRFVERFFEKYHIYNKSPIWYSGDSSSGISNIPIITYAINHKMFEGRLKGVLFEGPVIEILGNLLRAPYFYKVFHIINNKMVKKVEKKLKPILKGKFIKQPQKFFNFRHKNIVYMTKNNRYPYKYTNNYDSRYQFPNTRKGTPSNKIIAQVWMGHEMHAKSAIDPAQTKVKKAFNVPRTGKDIYYPQINDQVL